MPAPRGDKWETDIERRLAQLEQRKPFSNSGVHPNGDLGLDSDNFDDTHGFSLKGGAGDAEFNGNVDIGGTLNVTGNTVIGGTLSLPAGIIDNDALANPVIPGSIWKGTTANFGLTVAWASTVSQAAVVPSGCTQLLAFATTRLVAENTTGSTDYLYSDMDIGGQSAGGFALEVGAGKVGQSQTTFSRLMSGLTPGGSVTLSAYASSGNANWPAPAIPNVQQFAATLIWLR